MQGQLVVMKGVGMGWLSPVQQSNALTIIS
jgi:hypothetical protein